MSLQIDGLVGVINIVGGGSEPVLETATVKSTNVEQTIVPQEGVDGFDEIVVQAVTSEDVLDAMFNDATTTQELTMTDSNENHTCYGFLGGLDVILPNTITTIFDGAFYKNQMLKSLTANGVTTVGSNALAECTLLLNIDLPACTSIGSYCFQNSYIVESVHLGDVSAIPESAFAYMSSLMDVYLGYAGVTAIDFNTSGNPFAGSGGNTGALSIHVPADQLAGYQADSDWASVIADSADSGITITLVGDYDAQQA